MTACGGGNNTGQSLLEASGNTRNSTTETPSLSPSGINAKNNSEYQYDRTARFNSPSDLALDNAGNVYVLDFGNKLVRKVAANGQVSTLSGFVTPLSLTIDLYGNMYVVDGWELIKVTPDGTRTTIRSYPQSPGAYKPGKVVSDKQGQLYVTLNYRNIWWVQRVDLSRLDRTNDANVYSVHTWGWLNGSAFNSQGDLAASVNQPTTTPAGKVFFIPRSIQPAQQNFVNPSPSDPDTPGIVTLMTNSDSNEAITYDWQGNLYVVGFNNHGVTNPNGTQGAVTSDMHLTRIAPDGTMSTLMNGFPDGSTAPRNEVAPGTAIATSASGDIYFIFDQAVYRRTASGQVTVFAGKPGKSGSSD